MGKTPVWSLLQGFRELRGVGSEACIDPQCLQRAAAPYSSVLANIKRLAIYYYNIPLSSYIKAVIQLNKEPPTLKSAQTGKPI